MIEKRIVSVIIPTYNRAHVIDRAVKSVLAQTYKYVEVIVVDDGSTDQTINILQKFQHKIKIIRQENKKTAEARNTGIEHSSGEFIAFLDSDDDWLPNKLESQMKFFQDKRLGLVAGTMQDVFLAGQKRMSRSKKMSGYLTNTLLKYNAISTSSVIVRRSYLNQISPWFIRKFSPSEDWQLWIRLSVFCKFRIMPEVVGHRYLGDDNISSSIHDSERLLQLYKEIYESLLIDPSLQKIFRRKKGIMKANLLLNMANYYYQCGEAKRARQATLKALICEPFSIKWDTAIKILFIPK